MYFSSESTSRETEYIKNKFSKLVSGFLKLAL